MLRTDMLAICEVFMNCSENLIGICKKNNMTAKQEVLQES